MLKSDMKQLLRKFLPQALLSDRIVSTEENFDYAQIRAEELNKEFPEFYFYYSDNIVFIKQG